MQQLYFLGPERFEWRDVPAPRLQAPTDAIVRPLAVARCDLDLYLANGYAPFAGPFAFGHETVAEVVEAGEDVPLRPGQLVVVPFQLSCGRCATCAQGLTNACEAYPLGSAYGLGWRDVDYGGALSDLMHVPYADHMLLPLPEGVDPVAAASLADNVLDGWRAVRPRLEEKPGASVLIVGGLAQSVGLYAAGAAVAAGAGRVLYLDDDAGRRERAVLMGAEAAPLALGDGRQPADLFDIVVEAAGDAEALGFAVRSCGVNGAVTSVSMHFTPTTPVPLTEAYFKGLTFRTGRVNARTVLPDALACVACGKLHPEHVTHRVLPFEDAPDAMTDPGPKLVFVRS
jgi:threonine dehydrogenase-like Zn-dependent dehydrogenase